MSFSFAAARSAVMAGLFADTDLAERAHAPLALDMLSDWLPYRVYDDRARLYRNRSSKGFVLEVTPLVGADERTDRDHGEPQRQHGQQHDGGQNQQILLLHALPPFPANSGKPCSS